MAVYLDDISIVGWLWLHVYFDTTMQYRTLAKISPTFLQELYPANGEFSLEYTPTGGLKSRLNSAVIFYSFAGPRSDMQVSLDYVDVFALEDVYAGL